MRKRKKYYHSKGFLFAALITIFLVSGYFLFSNKTFQYCSYENYLLGIHDSLPVIEINYNNYRNDILEEITIKLNKESIEQAFIDIQKGYQLYYEEIAQKNLVNPFANSLKKKQKP